MLAVHNPNHCEGFIIIMQLTKEMMDSSNSFPYPPTIKLDIERDPNSSFQSTRILVEILGITERGRKYTLKPKQG